MAAYPDEAEWIRMIGEKERCNLKLREILYRGVPHHFRPLVWQLLCQTDATPEKYSKYMTECSPCESPIRRDIHRTYPEHSFYDEKGQKSLYNVLKAYSNYDREVGYCQGINFIVGMLLMQMPEEDTFHVFIRIMNQLREIHKPPMAMLGLCFYQLENLILQHVPEVEVHFRQQGVPTSLFSSGWFITLFTSEMSPKVSCRIMDIFVYEGMEAIFKVSVALLKMAKDDLLSLDLEGIQKYFHKDLPEKADADPDSLMELASSIKINSQDLKHLEIEYAIMKSRELSELQLQKLRSENRSLRCRVDNLELESASLAEKLVRRQVEAAMEAETEYALQQRVNEAERRLRAARENQEQEGYVAVKMEEIHQRDEMITCLQEELVKVRLSEAENDALVKELRGKIAEMEQDQKSKRETAVDNSVAHLQEELIAVKLREAEANLLLKDLKRKQSAQRTKSQHEQMQHKLQEEEYKKKINDLTQEIRNLQVQVSRLKGWKTRATLDLTNDLLQGIEIDVTLALFKQLHISNNN